MHRIISRQQELDQAHGNDASNADSAAATQHAASEKTVLARVEYLSDLMADILSHVGGDPEALQQKLKGKAGGSDGGSSGSDGKASDQAPSKAED